MATTTDYRAIYDAHYANAPDYYCYAQRHHVKVMARVGVGTERDKARAELKAIDARLAQIKREEAERRRQDRLAYFD